MWNDAFGVIGLHTEEFNSDQVLSDIHRYTEDSLNNLWMVADGVTLTVEDMTISSSGVRRSHFVVRGGEGSVLNAGMINSWGKTIDIAGFDLVNIENFVGSSNINGEVSISAKKIVHTLNELNTGSIMYDTVQGYAIVGTNEHIIRADEYILNRNVSSDDYQGVSFPQAAFYLLNVADGLPDEPGLHDGSIEMYARSIQLNNNAGDEAAVAVVGEGGAVFYGDDISIKGFTGILAADGRGSGSGTIEFHANTFRMQNEGGIYTNVGRYYTSGDILIEAKERGDLIGLKNVDNDMTLAGGVWNIDVKPVVAYDLPLTAFMISNDLKVESDEMYFGTSEKLDSEGQIGFKDGRLLTITNGANVSFGTTEKPVSGVIDSNFIVQSRDLRISGSALQVTGEIVLSEVLDVEPRGEMYLTNGSTFTGSV